MSFSRNPAPHLPLQVASGAIISHAQEPGTCLPASLRRETRNPMGLGGFSPESPWTEAPLPRFWSH